MPGALVGSDDAFESSGVNGGWAQAVALNAEAQTNRQEPDTAAIFIGIIYDIPTTYTFKNKINE